MFLIMGISTREEELDFSQMIICPSCGTYGRLEASMTYSYLSLFFIRVFKWNRNYYMRSTCCGSLYTIDEELGRSIEKGRVSRIDESDLNPIETGYGRQEFCENCGYPIDSEFEYCPKCGMKL